MDYLVIGSNGFAQVGSPDFFEKNKVEMRVLIQYINSSHPIPEEFAHMCFGKRKFKSCHPDLHVTMKFIYFNFYGTNVF